jgi:hypothetical protein
MLLILPATGIDVGTTTFRAGGIVIESEEVEK